MKSLVMEQTLSEFEKNHPKEAQDISRAADMIGDALHLLLTAYARVSPENGPIHACESATLMVVDMAMMFRKTATRIALDQDQKRREKMS